MKILQRSQIETFNILNKIGISAKQFKQRSTHSISPYYCSNPSLLQFDQPCIITDSIKNWKANTLWQIDLLKKNYGNNLFECGQDPITKETIILKLEDFLKIGKEKKLYLFDATFDEDCPDLLDHYTVPLLFQNDLICALPSSLQPNCRWFLVGKNLV